MSRAPGSLPGGEIVSPLAYAENGYPFAAWKRLRDEAPVHHVAEPGERPFWAVTRHEDITAISRDARRYRNGPRLVIQGGPDSDVTRRMLLNMDPPEHAAYRSLVNKGFTPRALRRIEGQVDTIATAILDDVAHEGETAEIDFVEEVAALLPIWVIAEMLGVPKSDWKLLFDWTNRTVGAGDPEYRDAGRSGSETIHAAGRELFDYFAELSADRRRNPRDDLATVLTHATIDGEPLPTHDLLSYYYLIVVAGNETTRNATTGGMLALIEHPGELARVREDPRLVKPLVEEILRWTSPVIHFCRTPAEDVVLHGQPIRAGETLCLFYPSANRDDRIFDEPDVFRVDRRPNRHIAFGIGEHVCLGAHVARLELQVIFRHLVQRLDFVELAGPVERLRSSIIGGVKHMPIRYRMR